jgi:hypothetical protein
MMTTEMTCSGEAMVRTYEQVQSMFFGKLPLELRRLVYEEVLGGEVFHLTVNFDMRRMKQKAGAWVPLPL